VNILTAAVERSRNTEAFITIIPEAQKIGIFQKRRAFVAVVTEFQDKCGSGGPSLKQSGRIEQRYDADLGHVETTPYHPQIAHKAGIGTQNYKQHGNAAGEATHTRNTSVVRPELVDFAADVELAARAVLSVDEFKFFKKVYLEIMVVIDKTGMNEGSTAVSFDRYVRETYKPHELGAVLVYDDAIRQKVGAELLRRGIFEINAYFKPVDVRDKKGGIDAGH
jgi:hypothetical protein